MPLVQRFIELLLFRPRALALDERHDLGKTVCGSELRKVGDQLARTEQMSSGERHAIAVEHRLHGTGRRALVLPAHLTKKSGVVSVEALGCRPACELAQLGSR